MLGEQTLFPVLRLWFVLILVIATFSNQKLAAAISEHTGRKLATDIPGFISIDCGATKEYRDEKTGIWYKTDAGFIDTGKNVPIFRGSTSANLPQQLMNIRIFPEGRKNCYTLKPEGGKDKKYLIRVLFKYGNYDGNNRAPIFDLYLGVNKWDTVYLSNSNAYTFAEIIHVPSTDTIDVCLLNIGSGVPLISVLELRLLDSSLYQIDSGALNLVWRFDIRMFNNDDKLIRYPDDVYDRIWYNRNFPGWFFSSTTSPINNQSNDGNYLVPDKVLRTAALTASATIDLYFKWTYANTSQFYVYFHFAEIEELENGRQREIRIYWNNIFSHSFRLEYLKPVTIELPISGNEPNFSIYGSGLPPILNALEIFAVRAVLPKSPTDINDVNAIMDIKQKYRVTRVWQGDPCVPSEYQWDGLTCSDDNPPRIISLNLSSSKLKGEIAASLFNLTAIQTLDLSFNHLTGPLPEFLAQLPDLKILNLTGNKLTGSVPEALSEKSGDGLLLRLDGNPNLCHKDSCNSRNKKVITVLTSVITVVVILGLLAILWKIRRKRRGGTKNWSLKPEIRKFTYSEVLSITNSENCLGEGSFGKVYRGTLEDGTQVAVKLLSSSSWQGSKQFQTEVRLLMAIHHRNLVSLIGYCSEGDDKMALIYEYMPEGNLQQCISDNSGEALTWKVRLQIAVDAARGLDYLHNGCRPPIVHRDLKTNNILLNEKLQAKISDFGMSRAFNTESDTHISTNPVGTYGYLDPEYHNTRRLNKKSDVFSFGVILLELITGLPAIIKEGSSATHISSRISPMVKNGDIENIVDRKLQGTYNTQSASKAIDIAMKCIPLTADGRPDISKVYEELKECLEIETAPEENLQKKDSSIEMAPLYSQTDRKRHTC